MVGPLLPVERGVRSGPPGPPHFTYILDIRACNMGHACGYNIVFYTIYRFYFKVFFIEGIISNLESWKETRKFTLISLKGFGLGKRSLEEKISEEFQNLYEVLEQTKGRPFCVNKILGQAVSNIICGIVFGKR